MGEYKYFNYPLPNLIQTIRENIYPKLAQIANSWMKGLNIYIRFPDTFQDLQKLCHNNNQLKATVLILKYQKGGHNTLHQDLYGDIYFPIQTVLFLNEPDKDFTGGEKSVKFTFFSRKKYYISIKFAVSKFATSGGSEKLVVIL